MLLFVYGGVQYMYLFKATILFIHVGLIRTVTLGHDSLEGGVVEIVVNTIKEFVIKVDHFFGAKVCQMIFHLLIFVRGQTVFA
jgi:hypothetical protein